MAFTLPAVWQAEPGASGRRRRCRFHAYVPDRLTDVEIRIPVQVAANVDAAEAALARLNESGAIVDSLVAIGGLLLRAESVASLTSAIASTVDPSAEAVLADVEAMAFAIDMLTNCPRLTIDSLLDVHLALMRHTDRPDLGGRIRTIQNWVGGPGSSPCQAVFVPPPPGYVPDLIEDLVAFLNTDRYSPLVQAALAHLQFERIHPFGDGNGRAGRMLIHVVLKRRALAPRFVPPISLVFALNPGVYIGSLRAANYVGPPDSEAAQTAMVEWLRIFTGATIRAAADAERFGLEIEQLAGRAAVPSARTVSASAEAGLPRPPLIKVDTVAGAMNPSTDFANIGIEQLIQAGMLSLGMAMSPLLTDRSNAKP
jgi:hypothetical protein